MSSKIEFKNIKSEKRWVELQMEKIELQAKKTSPKNEERLEIISSFMTGCKIGFNLNEAKIKKIILFLKEQTGKEKVKYGSIPKDSNIKTILFKDIPVLYIEKDGQILFKER